MKSAIVLLFAVSAFAEEPKTAAGSAKKAFNLKRSSKEETPVQVPTEKVVSDQAIEVWYINQDKRIDRKNCMEKQLKEMGIKPHRFSAAEPTKESLRNGGKDHDCLEGGLGEHDQYVDATAGSVSISTHTRMGIIGDTCSHKRLFQQLANSTSNAKYFVVLEDNAILNPTKFKTALNEFVDEKYGYKGPFAKDFQMVQMDFIGSACKGHKVGKAGGKAVFKPKDIFQPGRLGGGADCARYFGSQALLLMKNQLQSVVDHMKSHKIIPMDHIQGALPRGLSWRPQIARSPIQPNALKELPSFCNAKIATSSISSNFRQKAAPKSKLDLNAWMDAFRSETQIPESDE